MTEKDLKELVGSYNRVFKGGASKEDCDRVYKDIESRCFESTTTFDENHGRMAFNEGRRSIFVRIKTMMNTDVDQIKELPREYQHQP